MGRKRGKENEWDEGVSDEKGENGRKRSGHRWRTVLSGKKKRKRRTDTIGDGAQVKTIFDEAGVPELSKGDGRRAMNATQLPWHDPLFRVALIVMPAQSGHFSWSKHNEDIRRIGGRG